MLFRSLLKTALDSKQQITTINNKKAHALQPYQPLRLIITLYADDLRYVTLETPSGCFPGYTYNDEPIFPSPWSKLVLYLAMCNLHEGVDENSPPPPKEKVLFSKVVQDYLNRHPKHRMKLSQSGLSNRSM